MNTPLPPPAPGAAPSIVPVLAHLVMVLGITLALFAIPQVRRKLGHWFTVHRDTAAPATFDEDNSSGDPSSGDNSSGDPSPGGSPPAGVSRDLHSFDHSLYDRLNIDEPASGP